jgi:hypothetical protein
MAKLDRSATREIIDDFAREIAIRKHPGPKPEKAVIYFRNERREGFEREIVNVPIELLKYRKDNGRIRSDVISYEKEYGLLKEETKEAQEILRAILEKNDPEKNEELFRSINHDGQDQPAIITCDGFLINGNRRKMILEKINRTHPNKSPFMKVVVLPGKDDSGGPPTKLEIEEIENRYQHQSEGKAEYSKFNTALSIKRKIDLGMSLEQQLRDDPVYAGLEEKEFKKAVKQFEDEYLGPLICIDRYLEYLGRNSFYNTISESSGDKEGRWEAFLDYYKHVWKKMGDPDQRRSMNITEDEVGDVEDIAFKIIRHREFKNLGLKLHQVMRALPKWLSKPEAKEELFVLNEVQIELPQEKNFKSDGSEYDEKEKDRIWSAEHSTIIHRQLRRAHDIFEQEKSTDTPLELLDQALKKLKHPNMNLDVVKTSEIPSAMKTVKKIRDTLKEIEGVLYRRQNHKKS